MARTPHQGKAATVAELMKRISCGEDMRVLAQEAGRLAADIGLEELAAAERSLLDAGYAPAVVNQLSTALVLLREYQRHVSGAKDELQDGHILQRVTAEHGMFRCLAAELREAAADLAALECLSDTVSEFRRLVHALDHLSAMKEHFEREDDVILPYLRKLGWTGLCAVAEDDHARLRAYLDYLAFFVTGIQSLPPANFQTQLAAAVGKFCTCLTEHLAFEDGLLWPLALVVIDNPATWRTMKALCQDIGYCGIHVA